MGGGFSKDGGADAPAAEANEGWLASYIPACLLPASIDEHEQQQQPQPEQVTPTTAPVPAASGAGSILLRALWRKQQQEEATPHSDTSSTTTVTSSPAAPLSSPVAAPVTAAAPPRPINRADLLLRGLGEQTVFKAPGDIGGGACPPQPFAIDGCVSCDFFVLEATAQVTIDDCVDCRIVLGPCAGSLFLRDSSKCVVVAPCQQFRTRGCTDLDVRLYAATAPSIESSHGIRFSCYTCAYTSLAAQFAAAGLDPKGDNRWWDVYDFTPSAADAEDDGKKPHFSIMAGDATHAPQVKPLPAEVASQIGYSADPALSIVPLTTPPCQ